MLRLQGEEKPMIQRQIWQVVALKSDERIEARVLCARLLTSTVARRMITKEECMAEAANLPQCG